MRFNLLNERDRGGVRHGEMDGNYRDGLSERRNCTVVRRAIHATMADAEIQGVAARDGVQICCF